MKKIALITVATASLVGGCSTITPIKAVTLGDRSDTGYPDHYYNRSYSGYSQYGEPKVRSVESEIREVERTIQATLPVYKLNGIMVDTRVEKTSINVNGQPKDVIDLTVTWSSEKAIFPLGVYDIMKIRSADNKDAIKYLALLDSTIQDVDARLDELGVSYEIIAHYEGSADGVPMSPSGVVYKGEYGRIMLGPEKVEHNGSPAQIYIEPGQRLKNVELAALRAISLHEYVLRISKHDARIADKYSLTTTGEIGSRFRSSSVTFRIHPTNKTS